MITALTHYFMEGGSMIKAVFFDLYNTLVNYYPPREEIHSRVLKDFGIEISPEALLRPIMAADDFLYQEHARYPLGKRSKEETMALYSQYHGVILREAGLDASQELIVGILKKWMSFDLKMVLYDDVAPTLTQLRERGLILGLISNVDRDITPLYQELGLSAWLQVVVTSQEAGFSKPHPGIFQAALEKAGVKPSEAIYVGDQYEFDVVGADKAGMRGILLDRLGFFEEITECPRIRSLSDVVKYL
jgi:putative hydrolase of the HAD superfamily